MVQKVNLDFKIADEYSGTDAGNLAITMLELLI
jgi:hypothetical protein